MRTVPFGRHSAVRRADPPHVLVVNDDSAMRCVVTRYFSVHQVPTSAAASRVELERYLAVSDPALIVLGRRLGNDNGLDLLRLIRARSDVPVIIADGSGSEESDCVVGLELGADDYIARPFEPRELLARVRAILRRHKLGQPMRMRAPECSGYAFDGWRLEIVTRRLTNPDGRPVPLTKTEYNLLLAFLEAPQRPLKREQLLKITRLHEDIFDRSVNVQILRLRRRLGDGPTPRMILAERGIGYLFVPSVRLL